AGVFHLEARVDLSGERTGLYFDRGLINNAQYKYYFIAEGLSGARTAATAPLSVMAKADALPPEGAILINNGAAFTASPNVTLQLTASPDTTQMLISQDPSFTGAALIPFAASVPFTLAGPFSGPTTVTVFAIFRDAAQNDSVVYHA